MNFADPRYFFIFFLALWIGVGFLIAQFGGWGELSRFYRSANRFEGKRWYFRSGRMRWMTNYNGCLTVGSSPEGLFLAVLFLFRVGHPPLFVPWQDISVRTGKLLLWEWTEFRFRQAPSVRLRLYGSIGGELKAAAEMSWPGENLPVGF
jgi:hypothetical protein